MGARSRRAGACARRRRSRWANAPDGPFTPVVKLGKLVLGDQLLNKVRGKAITIHSQLITEFCQDYGVQPKTRGGLIKKAKNVGAALGFLS